MLQKEEAIQIIKDYNQWLDAKNKGQVSEKDAYEHAHLTLSEIIEAQNLLVQLLS